MNRFTILLLATALVLLSATEGFSRWGFDRISKVQRLQLSQRSTLLGIRDTPSTDASSCRACGKLTAAGWGECSASGGEVANLSRSRAIFCAGDGILRLAFWSEAIVRGRCATAVCASGPEP